MKRLIGLILSLAMLSSAVFVYAEENEAVPEIVEAVDETIADEAVDEAIVEETEEIEKAEEEKPLAVPIQLELYVSQNGDDGNGGTASAPFKTIGRAKEEVRRHNKNMTGDIVVNIKSGVYAQDETLTFTDDDSASNGYSIIYKGEGDGKTTISGGRRLTGWTLHDTGKNIWKTEAEGIKSRQMFVNGERRDRAAAKNIPAMKDGAVPGGEIVVTGNNIFKNLNNLTEVELIWKKSFSDYRMPIVSLEGDTLIMPETNAFYKNGIAALGQPIEIENAYEFLDEEGEWYLDTPAGVVYYKPKKNEDIETADVYIASLEKIIDISGTAENHLNGITFTGVSIKHGTWMGPNALDYGYANFQAGFCREFDPLYYGRFNIPNVLVIYADNIHFTNCIFENLGSWGIWMREGVRDSSVEGNIFRDISGNGIAVSHVTMYGTTSDPQIRCDNIKVDNNLIHDVGIEYWGSVGIFAGHPSNSSFSHNEIYNMPYTGMSIGWGWMNYWPKEAKDNDVKSANVNNKVIGNYVHDCMTILRDGGGIYTLGMNPGLEISGNVVANMGDHECFSYYLDNGSRWQTLKDNVSFGTAVVLYSKGADNEIYNNYFDEAFENTAVIGNQKTGHSEYKSLPVPEGHQNKLYDNTTVKNGYYPNYIMANAGLEYDWQHLKGLEGNAEQNVASKAEARVITAEGTLGKEVSGYEGVKAIDGNGATAMRGMGKGLWIAEFDLGVKRALNKLMLDFADTYIPTAYKVLLSADGENWTEITPEAVQEKNEFELEDVITRLIRVELLEGSMAVAEIGAYANDFIKVMDESDLLADLPFKTFDDIKEHWAKSDIEFLATLGIIKGDSDTAFSPERDITRAEWIVLVQRIAGIQKDVYLGGISDVFAKDWYADNIQTAYVDNMISLLLSSNRELKPNEAITREEAAYVLMNAVELEKEETEEQTEEQTEEKSFADLGNVAAGYKESVSDAVSAGFMTGTAENVFSPGAVFTRAQAATVLKRVYSR